MDDKIKKEEENDNKHSKEINRNKPIDKDITHQKNYRVPDANNKKGFEKINYYNFIGITKFIEFGELSEVLFVNHKFYNIISKRYYKKIPLVKTSIVTMKKNFFFKFTEDFKYYLEKNSFHIREIIRIMIESLDTEYFPKLGTKKFYFGKVNYNSNITDIFLTNSEIGKKSMKYLSFYLSNPNCKIKNINLSGNKISGEILEPLEYNKNSELNNITADRCIIDKKTLNILSNIKTKKLSLSSNNIDNDILLGLSSDYINELNISNNLITNNGVFHICKNIPNLTKLNLSNNNICDLSLVYICLYLKNPKSKLVSLNLKYNIITITGMLSLISTIEYINKENKKSCTLKKLNLAGNLLDYYHIPERLCTDFLNVNLEKLNLRNHSFSENDLNILFNFINNIKNIIILDLSKTVFDDKTLDIVFKRVAENNSLKKLKLQNCYLGKFEVNDNNENENIIKINDEGKNSNSINEQKLDKNIYNRNLGVESLDLGYNYIQYKNLDEIMLSNKLKELNIEGNDLYLWGNDLILFFDFIISNKFLEKLNLNKNNLRNVANKLLEKMYNYNNDNNSNCFLKYLSLEDNEIKEINLELTNLISNNKNLEVLNLKKNLIGDDIGNNYFFHGLFKNKISNIKEIDISDNKISLEFVNKIMKYNKENIIEKNNFILNITSKEIRKSYLNCENKKDYWDLIKLNCIKCF